jgi:hypothetical protein
VRSDRATREELAGGPAAWLLEAGPRVDPVFLRPSPALTADPLPHDLRSRLDSARIALLALC